MARKDPGGRSYGIYQISVKRGVMVDYLKYTNVSRTKVS